jgi:hypothetical protein
MLDLMYQLPGQKKSRECVITREMVVSKNTGPRGRREGGLAAGRRPARSSALDSRLPAPVPETILYDRSLRNAPHRPAARRRRFPAHDDAVRDRAAVVHPRARARARQGQAGVPGGAARRVHRRPESRGHLHHGRGGQRGAEPEAARRQHQGAGRGRRPGARDRVEGRQGLLPGGGKGPAEAEGPGRRRRADDEPRREPVRAVRQAVEQPPLRRDDRRRARRRPGQAGRHHRRPPAGGRRREAEPARDRLAARAAEPHRQHPRSRGRQAAGGPPHPVAREEADGEGAEGVLPQREDEGDPEGTGPQGRKGERDRGAAQEDRPGADAEGPEEKASRSSSAWRRCRRCRPRPPCRGTTSTG